MHATGISLYRPVPEVLRHRGERDAARLFLSDSGGERVTAGVRSICGPPLISLEAAALLTRLWASGLPARLGCSILARWGCVGGALGLMG